MKFVIGFIIAIGLLVLVFVLIFRGASNNNKSVQQQAKLVDYANSSVVMQFTEKGPVTADQNHDEVRITVSDVETSIETFKGYESNLTGTKTYANNSAAYADFLRALQLAGYTTGNKDKSVADERGYCATGVRYIMGIKDGDSDVQRLWSSSCGNNISFKGKTELVHNLFVRQVPDYSNVTAKLNL